MAARTDNVTDPALAARLLLMRRWRCQSKSKKC